MLTKRLIFCRKFHSASESVRVINNESFETDSFTNLTAKIASFLNRNLYNQRGHPICFMKERIIDYFNRNFSNRRGNPIFSVHDSLNPIVSVHQNFDSLLIPENHPSRSKTDCYYINKRMMLRAQMTAHQTQLIRMGFNNFLMVGDVYRRDAIDSTHYPVFHQLDAVRLFTPEELFVEKDDGKMCLDVKEKGNLSRTELKQEVYTLEATQTVEKELKTTLESLFRELFGPEIQYKWVKAYFPFTHPSWELEIFLNDSWIEMLGCGVIEHRILEQAGCGKRIGWAFGLGLERLAMLYYSIPDIRIFWSTDPGFLHQFVGKTCKDRFKFKPVSIHPASPYDISFWVRSENFDPKDFYEIAREICGDVVEQILLVDEYNCKKTGRKSYCFRVVYRSMVKTFTKSELNRIHQGLEKKVAEELKVDLR